MTDMHRDEHHDTATADDHSTPAQTSAGLVTSPADPAPGSTVTFYGQVFPGEASNEVSEAVNIAIQRELCLAWLWMDDFDVVFYDLEHGRRPDTPATDPGPRSGGLADLLAEAGRPDRRFDYVAVIHPNRLGRTEDEICDVLIHLAARGVQCISPNRSGSTDEDDQR
ncbi:MAG: recombinase family protein [Micromonosporaceae bacterium]